MITVRLQRFEGPLDLLLHLIHEKELEISSISVALVTEQYLRHVRLMKELDFDVASEFLVMAATLLLWKSRALLPKEETPPEAEDEPAFSQEDLVRQLLEHRRFQEAGKRLAELPRLGEAVFVRPNEKPPIERVWKSMDLTRLALSYQETLISSRRRKQVIRKETVSVSETIRDWSQRLEPGMPTSLADLVGDQGGWPELVVGFLATLELAKLQKLRVSQREIFSEILIELIERLTGIETQIASDFDARSEGARA